MEHTMSNVSSKDPSSERNVKKVNKQAASFYRREDHVTKN